MPAIYTTGDPIFTIPLYTNSAWQTADNNTFTYSNYIKLLEDRVSKLENESNMLKTYSQWFDIKLMLNDMREHYKSYKSEIIFADNPKELKIGFMCVLTSKVWEIAISTIRSTPQEMYVSDNVGILIPDAFNTQEEKKLLLDMINAK